MERSQGRESEEAADVESDIYGEVETADRSNELSSCQVFGYGTGHFYNDLCASLWFTYLLLFMEKVIVMRSSTAGLIMLIGQATDAMSTAFIGVLSDSKSAPLCFRHCGQRKSWHAFGTVLVTFSFPFIYNKCLICGQSTTDWEVFVWYAPYVIIFQFGWAAVQVSHLALLPELTCNESRRTMMNSVRHGFTVIANLIVFSLLSVLLYFDDKGSAIGPLDLWHFSTVSGMVIVLGLFMEIIFYTVINEPSRTDRVIVSAHLRYQSGILHSFKLSLLKWMYRLQFYQVGMLHMLCKLYINISQVYFPFYITHLPNFSKKYVAILPMVSYCSSLLISALTGLPFINRRCSLESLAFVGCLCGIASCMVMLFDIYFPVHIIAVLLGIAQAILLITSLSAVAKLIRQDTRNGAFVYGIFSSMDKISNGLALQIVQLFSPSSCVAIESAVDCIRFYRVVVTVVPGACLLIAFFVLLSLVISERWNSRDLSPVFEDSLSNAGSNQQLCR
ncbi:MFS/sugar transport family protein [Acanthocheilonema viteae]